MSGRSTHPRRVASWTPTHLRGTRRAICFFRTQGVLFAQRFDPTRREVSGDAHRVADGIGVGVGNPFTFAFSVSGTGIVTYWSGRSTPITQLTWFGREGQRLATAGEPGIHTGFTLDRDGKRAALEWRDPASNTFDIWQLDPARGGGPSRLTADGRFSLPVLSPDGRRLAMMARGRGIVSVTIGGSAEPDVIVAGPSSKWPSSWSSDGRFLAFTDFTPTGSRLWTTPVQSGCEATLYREAPFAMDALQFSPDGTRVAYMSKESGRFEVYVDSFPKPDHSVRVSTEGGGWPKWRRDGRELYYLALDRKLMASSVQTTTSGLTFSTPRVLFEGPGVNPDTGRTQFEPSPDGSRFLFNARVEDPTPRGLTVITNWPALLK